MLKFSTAELVVLEKNASGHALGPTAVEPRPLARRSAPRGPNGPTWTRPPTASQTPAAAPEPPWTRRFTRTARLPKPSSPLRPSAAADG